MDGKLKICRHQKQDNIYRQQAYWFIPRFHYKTKKIINHSNKNTYLEKLDTSYDTLSHIENEKTYIGYT